MSKAEYLAYLVEFHELKQLDSLIGQIRKRHLAFNFSLYEKIQLNILRVFLETIEA